MKKYEYLPRFYQIDVSTNKIIGGSNSLDNELYKQKKYKDQGITTAIMPESELFPSLKKYPIYEEGDLLTSMVFDDLESAIKYVLKKDIEGYIEEYDCSTGKSVQVYTTIMGF